MGASECPADLGSIYLSVRVKAALAALAINAVDALTAGRPEIWLLVAAPLVVVADGLSRRRRPVEPLLAPLTIDSTAIGVSLVVAGSVPAVIAYSMLMIGVVAALATRREQRILFPAVALWTALGLVAAWRTGLPDRWDSTEWMLYTSAHLLVAMAALGAIVSAIMRRLREVELQRNHLIGGFAHDIKNALAGAVGMGEMLTAEYDELERDELLEYAWMAIGEGREALIMTEDLLAFGRAEAGHLEVAKEPVDLVAETRRVLDASGRHDTSPELVGGPAICLSDAARVRQILRNLVSNADRHGGDRVRVSVGSEGPHSFVRVADSGPPIPESERQRIFDPYDRARDRPRHDDSVGLGLAISRRLARLMGGDLVYRHTGEWGVFELTLPASDDRREREPANARAAR